MSLLKSLSNLRNTLSSGLRHRPGAMDGHGDGVVATSRRGSAASNLLRRLGLTGGAAVEQLEERKLLFSLTISPGDVNAATGIGTRTAFFGYVVPYLNRSVEVPDPSPVTPEIEDFEDANLGNALGQQFASGLRVDGNLDVARVINATGNIQDTPRWLEAAWTRVGHTLRFEVRSDDVNNPAVRTLSQAAFDISGSPEGGDATGLDTNQVRINLVLNNRVTQSFTGNALRALIVGNPALGVGRITLNAAALTPDVPAFDAIEIVADSGYTLGGNSRVRLDNFAFNEVFSDLSELVTSRIFGAQVTLSGSVGTTASFFDLQNQAMVNTIALGIPDGREVPLVDPEGNLIPNFNDGIGRIELTGTDARSSLQMWGGLITPSPTDNGTADRFENGFAFNLETSTSGLFDAFTAAGFGYAWDADAGQVRVVGLPSGPGSVIVGSPFVRGTQGIVRNPNDGTIIDIGNSNPFGAAIAGNTVISGFNNSQQGVFVRNGQSMGSVVINGVVHGSSQFTGTIDRFAVGYLVGSVTVQGDAGSIVSGTDAGMWVPTSGFGGQAISTGSQIFVGRTVNEIAIAGRNRSDIVVLGDITNPVSRPARDVLNYFEKEYIHGGDPANPLIRTLREKLLLGNGYVARANTADTRGNLAAGDLGDVTYVFGDSFYRNDTLSAAETITTSASAVRIVGETGGKDSYNGEDRGDVFAFAVDGTSEVVIQQKEVLAHSPVYMRVVDARGRTLAASQGVDPRRAQLGEIFPEIRFRPTDGSGVYYLVVTDTGDANAEGNGNTPYSILVNGMAGASLGGLRVGGSMGFPGAGSPAVNVLNGNIGAIRVGMGSSDGGGGPQTIDGYVNNSDPANFSDDDLMAFHSGSLSVAGSVYGIIAGGDISLDGGIINIRIDGNLGMLYTGTSPVIAGGPNEGDWNNTALVVGGSIGRIDVSGGIGMDQDEPDPRGVPATQSVVIRTGGASASSGLRGDIGYIRTGFHVASGQLDIRTSPGSVIGAVLTSQDSYDDPAPRSGVYTEQQDLGRGIPLFTGAGGDVRFVDFPRIDLERSVDINFPIIAGQIREFIDDSGARLTLAVDGAAPGAIVGTVRVAPVDGSQGVAIARITADLRNGITLRLTSSTIGNAGVVSIGRIQLTGDATSILAIGGTAEVDVLRIDVAGAMSRIDNETLGGDFVTVDAEALDTLTVNGDLGFTQLVSFGPSSIATRLGLDAQAGGGGEIGGPIGWVTDEARTDNDFGGGIYRDTNNDVAEGGDAFLDDLGSPFDDVANGLVVRSGNVTLVSVGGRMGDIILQDTAGTLTEARANDDNITPVGGFDGLVGTVYAFNIGTVNVGDGIADRNRSTVFGVAGVFADNDIIRVESRPNGTMSGVISAGNSDVPGADEPVDPEAIQGINTVAIPGGNAINAFISVGTLDEFWDSPLYFEEVLSTGDVNVIDIDTAQVVVGPDGLPVTNPGLLDGGNFFRSEVQAANINRIALAGYYDASLISATANVDTIEARGFRNRTITGDRRQFVPSEILVGRDINRITAREDIVDQRIDVAGEVRASVNAVNLIRTKLDVDNISRALTFTGDVRASTITTGDIRTLSVRNSINTSTILVSGIISGLSVTNRIDNSRIEVTGPSGRIDSITAVNGIDAQIISSGPIGSITVTAGDLAGEVRTAARGNGQASNITLLSASRDMRAAVNAQGSIASITAGRNIGSQQSPASILATGDVGVITAPTGQLYSDVRSGGNLTTATFGGASSKPDTDFVGRGSLVFAGTIGTVTIGGDFGGDILSYTGGITSVIINNGSFLPGRTIAAFDGTIASLTINNGNLLGNVEAGFDITSLLVTAVAGTGTTPAPSVFGNIGIDPSKSQFVSVDALRNQLPAGVGADRGIDGGIIKAGRNIVNVKVDGSVFESGFYAGQQIQTILVAGRVANNTDFGTKGSFFAAGDRINAITVGVSAADTTFLAGAVSLGADNRPGGRNANADVIKPGVIQNITVTADGLYGVAIVAGAEAGANGIYGDSDDRLSLGTGEVRALNVPTNLINVRVVADLVSAAIKNDTRLTTNNSALLDAQPLSRFTLDSGLGTPDGRINGSRTITINGTQLTATFAGTGEAYLETFVTVDALTGEQIAYPFIILRNTRGGAGASGDANGAAGGTGSTLTVSTVSGFVDNLRILSNDDASLSSLTVNGELRGESQIIVDAGIDRLALGSMTLRNTNNFTNSGVAPGIYTGGNVTTLTAANLGAGFIEALNVGTITLTGNFTSNLQALNIGAVTVVGLGGVLSADRAITSITASGNAEGARVRAGTTLGAVTAGIVRRSVFTAADNIASFTARGEVFDTAIAAGIDTGRDANFEGTGLNADVLSAGSVGNVTVGGDFRESDIIAGIERSVDRFFGTRDDRFAGGRSSVGNVTISGSNVGSTRTSETYRISSTGAIGRVTIGGLEYNGPRGNFAVAGQVVAPLAIQVTEIITNIEAQTYSADLVFNQPMDEASLKRALSVFEVRGNGATRISLIPEIDYVTTYIEATNTLRVSFARAITSQNLPQLSGRPGPGIYDFTFTQAVARARVQSARFDGNGNGIVEVNDNYTGTTQIGDAGDRLVATPVAGTDLYGASNLNLIFDNPNARDGIADANKSFTIRGIIGDNPDHNNNTFRPAGDIDLYRVTLQAGQILRIGAIEGAAALIPVKLYAIGTANGRDVVTLQVPDAGDNDFANTLPSGLPEITVQQGARSFLIKTTGEYVLSVGRLAVAAGNPNPIQDPTPALLNGATLNNPEPEAFTLGSYNFTVSIFDDADSGFTSNTSSGNGTDVVEAPAAIAFAGIDQIFGTPDDVSSLVLGEFTFTLNRGADNTPNTADDVVSGANITSETGASIVSTRSSAGVSSVISSAIGAPGFAGAPSQVSSDVDVFHLNGRQAIAAGTKLRLTVRLTEQGTDLGSRLASGLDDSGSVQFGVFDTTNSTTIDDATLLFSPTDFSPFGGRPNTTIANDGSTRYGYDANGDFFIEFVTSPAQGSSAAGTYAVYLQGIVQNDYQIVVDNLGAAAQATRKVQNVFIETNGGEVSWLEAGGLTTRLDGFSLSRLGFTGSVNGTNNVQTDVLNRTLASLNALYQGAGFDVRFSTNPGDFEFQEFSTIYLTNSTDPLRTATNPFGISQRSDPLNARLEDESVVFVPAFSLLGYVPSNADVENLVQSLTASIARRSGEMMGLRMATDNTSGIATDFDPLAANSVRVTPAGNNTYVLTNNLRDLSGNFDSIERDNFFLGKQRTFSLLSRIVSNV